mgnify:CR=1 FL=1
MRLNALNIDGFRSLKNLKIKFDPSLTVIVGENDAGKTSLIDCLKVVTQGRSVTLDDFTYGSDQIKISVEIDNFKFCKEYHRVEGVINEQPLRATPTEEYVQRTYTILQDENMDVTSSGNQDFIRDTAKLFGLTVRANSNIGNLRRELLNKLGDQSQLLIENAIFPKFNNIQLDGKHFENVPAFFKEVFLREKQANIWSEKINNDVSIEDFVRKNLESYSSEVSQQIQDQGIIEKLRTFLPDLTEVKVEPIFQPRDLNVDAKVKFLENGNEISIENKGDGTKRRMTMALLEIKKEQGRLPNDEHTIYLFDEPDTHLHVRAQIELIKTVEAFSLAGNQVILTTHSPFILNAVKPSQIRLLVRNQGSTVLKALGDDPNDASRILRALGVENTHLFFSRKIVIVEGETEEKFLHAQYLNETNRTISSGLINVINVNGVQNVAGFSRAILELHDPTRIFILCDNDASSELQDLINRLNIPSENKYLVGTKEFEDAFEPCLIYQVWREYHAACSKALPLQWTIENIQNLKEECIVSEKKFSKELRKLNQGGKTLTKPILGSNLGERLNKSQLPLKLQNLIDNLIAEV